MRVLNHPSMLPQLRFSGFSSQNAAFKKSLPLFSGPEEAVSDALIYQLLEKALREFARQHGLKRPNPEHIRFIGNGFDSLHWAFSDGQRTKTPQGVYVRELVTGLDQTNRNHPQIYVEPSPYQSNDDPFYIMASKPLFYWRLDKTQIAERRREMSLNELKTLHQNEGPKRVKEVLLGMLSETWDDLNQIQPEDLNPMG